MKVTIINLFSFLNITQNESSLNILANLKTIEQFKKFENIPKESLDFLVCLKSFSKRNKGIVDYLKSLGGSEDVYILCKELLDMNFKDLKIYHDFNNPKSILYGTKSRILISDTPRPLNTISFDNDLFTKVKGLLEAKFSNIKNNDIYNILGEYIKENFNIKRKYLSIHNNFEILPHFKLVKSL